ncbi:uncharacterized protein SPPG_06086 [Spizellomyces punctatus DAOM BR117]|uniref:TLC domain-containing protein n=1 Tax=Spizellomyces punctatus (strain DAOM BR117) TaxID=645134 RepID=A0A0L0HBX5_SPIPD|nr:uncharacterized protein SPPG_06086 [Spizellomyces punctatus DAOM BR117]KNC98379.1 hypothetical protein SPPG_06086 [Spizellomyces punctatus DAOM BR117]|eukprot:XP_016606419.1 hypothetical protein SPPG_06086 [Spizellomyces punctatus DAOM BR117]
MATSLSYLDVLSDPRFHVPFGCGALALSAAFFTLPSLFPTLFATEKQRAWIVTGLTALVMTSSSLPFHYSFFTGSNSLADVSLMDSAFAIGLCGFFASYCVTDLLLGTLFYRSEVHPLSGYVHHSLYAWMVTSLVTYHVPGGFCTLSILELPTLVMAIGRINKAWRSDALFGATFFTTRICLHIYFVYEIWRAWPDRQFYWFLLGVLPMHLLWFKGWVQQQIRMRKEKLRKMVPSTTTACHPIQSIKPEAQVSAEVTSREDDKYVTEETWGSRSTRHLPRPFVTHRLRAGSSILEHDLDRITDPIPVAPVLVG